MGVIRKKPSPDTNIFYLLGEEDGFDPKSWYNLPDCTQNANEAEYILTVTVPNKDELHKLADLINCPELKLPIKRNTKSIWYPELFYGERGSNNNYAWVDESLINFGDSN